MWEDKDAGGNSNAPLCQSMDRIVGSMCGECKSCPDEPWKDGEKTRCSDDVGVFMLSRDMTQLVMVRFAKTSTKTGHQLFRSVKLGTSAWAKWWRLTLEKQTRDTYKWYSIMVSPAGETDDELYTPEAIDPFLQALSVNLSTSFILPGIARAYIQSAQEAADGQSQAKPSEGETSPADENTNFGGEGEDESEFSEMPEDDVNA